VTDVSAEGRNLNWLLSSFVAHAHGARHAIAVSSDGLLVAMSEDLDRASADRLAAVTSGLLSLSRGAAAAFRAGAVRQAMVEMEGGFFVAISISDGSCLAVLTTRQCDIGVIGYEMAVLAERVGGALSPHLIAELQRALPV